jgi:hypothetical protein
MSDRALGDADTDMLLPKVSKSGAGRNELVLGPGADSDVVVGVGEA